MAMAGPAILFIVLILCDAGSLVGPGGVVPFGGSNAPGQRVSYGRITSSQDAFFIGGSSIYALNGVYVRASGFPAGATHQPLMYKDGLLGYVNRITGWHMGLVDWKKPEDNKEEQDTRWIIVDSSGKNRFVHAGASLLPGSGLGWSHIDENGDYVEKEMWDVNRETGQFKNCPLQDASHEAGGQVAIKCDSVDELPWQLVGLGDPSKTPGMLNHQNYVHQMRHRALKRDPLDSVHGNEPAESKGTKPPPEVEFFSIAPEFSRCSEEHLQTLAHKVQEKCTKHSKRSKPDFTGKIAEVSELKEKADAFVVDGNFEEADKTYIAMLELMQGADPNGLASQLGSFVRDALFGADSHKWIVAQIHLMRSRNLRWARRFSEAHQQATFALGHIAAYTAAIVEQGLINLEMGEVDKAIQSLELALKLDRSFEDLDSLLILAQTFSTRREAAREKHGKVAGLLSEPEGTPLASSADRTEKKPKGYDVANALRDRPNFYALLEMPVDFVFDDHLKRQFRKFSRAAHPDRNGGSNTVFQEIAKAAETLEDPKKRLLYDTGFDLDSAETQAGGYQADEATKLRIEKQYFPERFGFFAFMNAYDNKRRVTGFGGRRMHGNVYDEVWDKPLPPEKSQQPTSQVHGMLHNEEL